MANPMQRTESLCIFLVDDDEMFQKSIGQYIKNQTKLPLRIKEYTSGEECVKNLHLKPDVVVLDYMLGLDSEEGMDGIETLRKIRKNSPETAVIMLSGKANVEIVAEAMKRGAVDFIEKNDSAFSKVQSLIGDAIQSFLLLGSSGNHHDWMKNNSGHQQSRSLYLYPKSYTFFSPITLPGSENKKMIQSKKKKKTRLRT
jgi:two-component system OmpR family response regulator